MIFLWIFYSRCFCSPSQIQLNYIKVSFPDCYLPVPPGLSNKHHPASTVLIAGPAAPMINITFSQAAIILVTQKRVLLHIIWALTSHPLVTNLIYHNLSPCSLRSFSPNLSDFDHPKTRVSIWYTFFSLYFLPRFHASCFFPMKFWASCFSCCTVSCSCFSLLLFFSACFRPSSCAVRCRLRLFWWRGGSRRDGSWRRRARSKLNMVAPLVTDPPHNKATAKKNLFI